MSGVGSFVRLVRKPRGNRRVARFAARASRGSSVGTLAPPGRETARLWRVLLWGAVALSLSQVQAGLRVHLPSGLLLDLPVLIVVFGALHLGALEGALAAFVVGYVADLFVQGPPGLCRFMAVATWTGVRIASARLRVPPFLATIGFTFAGALVYQLGVLSGLHLVADPAAGPGTIAWLSAVPGAALTALAAWPFQKALGRIDELTAGTQPG